MLVFHRILSRIPPRLFLALTLLSDGTAQAGLIYHLASPRATPGATIELQGVLYNDTGNPLSTPMARQLEGEWVDAAGHATPAHFQLRTSPDAASLPANTFTQMIWTGQVPAHASGLLTLHLQGADDTLLALRVGSGTAVAQNDTVPQSASANPTPAPETPVAPQPAQPVPAAAPALSPFDTFRNAISSYDPIYFVVGNKDGATARFQLSFKYRLFTPQDAEHPGFMDNWYFGYTQTSLWDLHSDSIPFVDTTYNPSLFWARESLLQSRDKHWFLGLNTGFEHKSNGKAGDVSRSLNDFYVQPEFNYRSDGGGTLTFMPRFKHYAWTDPDMRYPDSLGYVDWKLRWAQDDGIVLSGLYRQGTGGRNATQIEAAWPLKRTFLHMNGYLYAQYFRGYGETLLDYDQKHDPQFRIGIAFVP
jgi:outer membrane phospholipase A